MEVGIICFGGASNGFNTRFLIDGISNGSGLIQLQNISKQLNVNMFILSRYLKIINSCATSDELYF
jgi:hypothetical protein